MFSPAVRQEVDLNERVLMFSPTVRQEVDLNERVPRSAVGPDRKLFCSKNRHDQLMAHFIIPELHLEEDRTLENTGEPREENPDRRTKREEVRERNPEESKERRGEPREENPERGSKREEPRGEQREERRTLRGEPR